MDERIKFIEELARRRRVYTMPRAILTRYADPGDVRSFLVLENDRVSFTLCRNDGCWEQSLHRTTGEAKNTFALREEGEDGKWKEVPFAELWEQHWGFWRSAHRKPMPLDCEKVAETIDSLLYQASTGRAYVEHEDGKMVASEEDFGNVAVHKWNHNRYERTKAYSRLGKTITERCIKSPKTGEWIPEPSAAAANKPQ